MRSGSARMLISTMRSLADHRAEHRYRPPVAQRDQTDRTVDEHPDLLRLVAGTPERRGLRRDLGARRARCPTSPRRPPSARSATSGSSTSSSASKSPSLSGGGERVEDAALGRQVRGGGWRGPNPAPGAAGQLGGRGRRAAHDLADLRRTGTPNMSCSTNAIRSRGFSASSTTSRAKVTASACSADAAGSASRRVTTGSGTWKSSDSSRRDFRDRRRSRQTRLTTVVSQPRRLTTSLVSVARQPQPAPPARRRPPRPSSRASGRRPSAGGRGAPRTPRPAAPG